MGWGGEINMIIYFLCSGSRRVGEFYLRLELVLQIIYVLVVDNNVDWYFSFRFLGGLETVREIPVVKDATSTGWRNMRSWFEFCNWKRYRKPTLNKLMTREYYTGRLMRNIQYFHVNYICVFLLLFVYCM